MSIPDAKDIEVKQALINKLVECRQQVFNKNKTLKDNILKDTEKRFEQKGKLTKVDRKVLLENEFFKLSEFVRSLASTTD